jgi:ribonuclease-3
MIELFLQAITHVSVCPWPIFSYERVEFLGDALLKYLASIHVYNLRLKNGKLPENDNFNLSEDRQPLINNEYLASIARKTGFAKFLVSDGKNIPDKAYSDIMEALIGAIYIDSGLRKVNMKCGCQWDLAGNFLHSKIFQ